MGNALPLILGLLFLSGLSVPLIYPFLKKKLGWVLSILPLLLFFYLLGEFFNLNPREATIIESSVSLLKGMDFNFRIDGLSLIFGLLISGIGFLIVLYAAYYMAKYERQGQFFTYLILFMAAMVGLVFSDNLIGLFIFWELTSVASFFLIGFNHHLEKSRLAALHALLITGLGGLCLLLAVIMIGNITGTYQISELIANNIHLGNHPHYYLVLTLVILAAITKSAQFPFHFWLPGAMEAPTPVSAYLHSATMVNAGVFILMRMYPVLGGTFVWKYSLMLTGVITMFLGAFFSMGQKDLKRILAFTTISALGTMVLLIGIDTSDSLKAALVFFIVHGLYKGGLFMVAGIVDKSTGTRDVSVLSSLLKPLPITAIATTLALVSMAGLPPMLGFIGKELIYEAKIQLPGLAWLLLPLGIGANIMMVAISATIFFEIFWPNKNKTPITIKHAEKEFSYTFLAGPVVLAFLGLILGIAPKLLDPLISNALFFMRADTTPVSLTLWHGFNPVLWLSIFTIVSGVIVFILRKPATTFINRIIVWFDKYHLPNLFNSLIYNYVKIASHSTLKMQHGYHRFYLLTFFMVTMALVWLQWFRITDFQLPEEGSSPIKIHVALLLLVTSMAVIFAVLAKSRLSAILAMGVVGYGIGLLYLYYGAVDLAITQFLAETVMMVLFVMVIYYLPGFAVLSTKTSRIRDALISISVGVTITLIVLKARFINLHEPISGFYAENSYTQAHGRNIVNVILVDFRALDTMGEVTVLTLAAAGVYSLFRFQIKRLKEKKQNETSHE
jgi:multicomponent Na+:H+ antiporter subunit A